MTETNFKHTDLGLIPHDWEVKTFADLCHNITDGSHFSPHSCALGYYMPSVKDMTDDGFDFSACKIISEKDFKNLVSAGCKPKKNDILIAKDGSILKYAFAVEEEKDIVILSSIAILRPNLDLIYPKYIAKYIKYEKFVEYALSNFKTGTGVPRIVLKGFSKLSVPIPPTLAEQERIAGALSSIDTLIGALTEQIEKKRYIKQGAMQQLLTGKKRLAGFTGEWKEVRLGDLVKMNSGGTPTSTNPAYYNGDIPFLSISDMTSSGKYIQSTEKTITQLGLENSSARLFPAGTLIYAMYASIGKCSITNIDTAISQAILGFKLSDALDRDYLYYHFCFIENIVKDMGQTGTQSNLSKKIVEDFELTIPPTIAEQSAIAAVLSRMDTEIAALEQKRDKYIAIKSGMMQNLLTGKIRLV